MDKKTLSMKILLLGGTGQVGFELQKILPRLGKVKVCNRDCIDFSNPVDLVTIISNYAPNIIVNAVAYTNVDKAESEIELATKINEKTINLLAKTIKKSGALLVHYSTDYVFDGKKNGSYTEIDKTNPLSIYGKTKLAGENAIIQSGCEYLIFRTSWVYSTTGNNFIKTIMRLAQEKPEIKVVADQFGVPTNAKVIANITLECLQKIIKNKINNISGIYNLVPHGKTNWFEFARFIVAELHQLNNKKYIHSDKILAITSNEYKTIAKRPKNSSLNISKIKKIFDLKIPNWQRDLKDLIKNMHLKNEK